MEPNKQLAPEQPDSQKQMQYLEKIQIANVFAQSLAVCFERKYLENIFSNGDRPDSFHIRIHSKTEAPAIPTWIKIEQVGKPLDDKVESCFAAIQKILHACFLPKQTQLLFLIVGDGIRHHMYLGVRTLKSSLSKTFMRKLGDFISGLWPGLSSQVVDDAQDEQLQRFRQNATTDGIYDHVYALTGIPSADSQYKTVYPATVDKLMAGLRGKNYAYLVVADPIPSDSVDQMLNECRDLDGRAESLKSFNFSEGRSTSDSEGESFSENHGTSETRDRQNPLLEVAGLAATLFPQARIIAAGIGLAQQALQVLSDDPSSTSSSQSTSYGTNRGHTEGQSKTLSSNIVNKQAEAMADALYYHSKRLELGKAVGMWHTGVYLLTENEADMTGAALQLRSLLSGQESVFEPIRLHDIHSQLNYPVANSDKTLRDLSLARIEAPTFVVCDTSERPFAHPLGQYYQELKSVLTTKELSYLVNFPLRSVPGISVIDTTPEFSLSQQSIPEGDTVVLGDLQYGGAATKMTYEIPTSVLSRHTLLSGINGSGKTNTVQAILNSIQSKLPYLVIEPAKTEYVDWALSYNKQHPDTPIDIYIPGCKTYKSSVHPEGYTLDKQLRINPFEVVWLTPEQEPNVLTHIDRLKSTFAAAFPMYDILPILMEDLIYTVYQNKSTDWLSQPPVYGQTLPPTLNGMKVSVDRVIANHQYEERIERNMKACLNTRIDTLMRGWKGDMLNTLHSTGWESLFERPCIINLSYVGDDSDKAFFMALILQFLYEYRTACAEIGRMDFNDNTCRHLTVIEEAHRVMANCTNPEQPQYKTAMMFSNMLSEIRAYGEGLFLVDQVPTRLIPDAIKNTNLKITHRLVAEDDCKAVGEAMGLTAEQRKIISKLKTGQCIVSGSSGTDTYWVQVHKMK